MKIYLTKFNPDQLQSPNSLLSRLSESKNIASEIIKEIAQKMLELVKQIDSFKYSLEAFNLLCH